MKIIRNIDSILEFIVGFLLFGPFASNLFHDVLHLPMVVPELLYLPILFFFYKKLGLRLITSPNFVIVVFLWFFFFLMAILWGTYDIAAITSTARSFLCVLLFYPIGKIIVVNKALIKFLLNVSMGSVFSWVVSSFLNFQKMLQSADETVVYGNMIAISYAFSILLLYKRNYILLILLFVMNVFLSFTTALRRQILVSLMSIGGSLSLLIVKYRKIKYLILVVLLSIPIFFAMPQIEIFVKDANPYLHHRIFERSEDALQNDLGAADKSRIDNQLLIFTEFFDLILPHGYVSQHTSKDKTGIFNDIPMYMLAYTFGVLVLYVYILYYIKCLLTTFFRFCKYDNEFYGILLVVGLITFFLHFIEASMFIYTYTCPLTGFTLGLLFRKDYVTIK